MSGLRKFAIGLITFGLIVTLQTLVTVLTIVPTATNREAMKDLFAGEEAYRAFIATAKNTSFDQLEPTSEISDADRQQFEADRRALYKNIDKLIPFDHYQKISEQTADGMYDWLEGKTARPEFEIVIAKDKKEAVALLEPVFLSRYAELPACPNDFRVSRDFSPLSTECRPPGIGQTQIKRHLKESADDPDFDDLFANVTVSGEDLGISDSQSAAVQRSYSLAKATPVIFGGIAVALSIFLALLVRTLPGNLKAFGIVLLVAAVPMLLTAALFRIFPSISLAAALNAVTGNTALASFTETLTRILIDRTLIYSGIMTVIGIALLVCSSVVRRRRHKAAPFISQEQVEINNQNIQTPV